jgi:predicted ATPase/DNA-binding SARP family transcriptional activator
MRFGVLGPLAVWTSAGEQLTVPGLKVRALLADLLVHAGEPVSADRLVDDLWGERAPADPAGALQVKVSQLRRVLAAAEPGGRELIEYRPPGYRLRAGGDMTDAGQFGELLRRARTTGDPRARAARLTEALGLWRGAAFADFGDQLFTQAAAGRLEEERLVALEEQAEARLELGDHAQLAGELAGLVARHPLRERLRAAQLTALYRAGRPSEALESYRELRRRLADELGLDPGLELTALQQAILVQDPALRAPTEAPVVPAMTNVPASFGGLIGRDGAVSEVRTLLGSGRLVTLTGPGGVGKTRLALAVAAQLAGGYPDGTWLVELATETGEAGVAELVAAAVGLADSAAPGPLADRLAGALGSRQLLLVLDNCEHVIGPVAALAGRLLRAGPGVRILATSQEPLAIGGEQRWEVPPLGLPGPGQDDAELVAEAGAVQLFAARAAAADPGFAVDAGNARAVASICRRLDGIPLALELAAARVRALGVHTLAGRLDDRFRLLTAGQRGAPARQRTLRAMIDWSWELATGPERIVLRRLAVHADGCTLTAAEQTCAGEDLDQADVADLLARLVDRSLVTVTTEGTDEPRYRLLESVAAYGTERLREAGELGPLQRRHREFYTALAERGWRELRGHDQQRWLYRLDREGANIHSALEGSFGHQEAELALRLAGAMTWYWFLRGRLTEARRVLSSALALLGSEAGREGHGPALDGLGSARAFATAWLAGITLLAGGSADDARAALSLYGEVDDPAGRAESEWFLGFGTSDFGDLSPSEELTGRALAAFEASGNRWGIAAALSTRAKHASIRGDLDAVRDYGQRSLELFRELGDGWGQLQATEWLGARCETVGDYEQGRRLHAEGLRLARELGLWPQAADRLTWLGRIAVLTGDYPQARELLGDARRLAVERDYKPGEVFADISLGALARREGDLDGADAVLHAVLDWHGRMGHGPDVAKAMVLTELGLVASQRGDLAAARGFQDEALAIARGLGDPLGIGLGLEGPGVSGYGPERGAPAGEAAGPAARRG